MLEKKRKSGVLMHVSSLPGEYSIGSFGAEARTFVDFLRDGGFSVWQVLPFCMTDECNSPYKSLGAFSGNPFFIDLPTLYEKGLITLEELRNARQSTPYLCEFERLGTERLTLLFKAAMRIFDRSAITEFINAKPELRELCEFLALRDANRGAPWYEWDKYEIDSDRLFFWQFIQHEFLEQWQSLKAYANGKGISIIGDLPIYVAHDSADVWANKEQFLLDEKGYPMSVAGVPPDYFSKDGQLWGNPLYNWKRMRADGYVWWQRRLEYALELFDGVRIDHFRGFEAYWSVPAGAKTAKEGSWVKGPGRKMIDIIKRVAGDKLIIAEDLGDITDAVRRLLDYSGFPGMRVLQFAFLGDDNTPHLPYRYTHNSVAYTGTHDNNTLLGYIWEMSDNDRRVAFAYSGADERDWNSACVSLIKTVLGSHAGLVILPVQDLLGFGADTRMNTPGTSSANWSYRITREQLASLNTDRFKELNRLYGRA